MKQHASVIVSDHTDEPHNKTPIQRLAGKRWLLASITIFVFAFMGSGVAWWASAATTTVSLWDGKAVPKTITASQTRSIELGMKFKAKVAGQVTGLRFYKGPQNTGQHVGTLWDTRGNRLAKVTFANESRYGWQTATFASPVNIAANVAYVISYSAPNGRYSETTRYFTSSFTHDNLTGVRNGGQHGANGVYGRMGRYPQSSGEGRNYWVDVLFTSKRIAPKPAPAPPSGLAAIQNGTSVILSWIPAPSDKPVASYKIFRNGTAYSTASGTAATWTDTQVTAGNTYEYYLQSVDSTGTTSAASTKVSVKITTAPAPTCPAGTTGTPPNCVTTPPTPPNPGPTPTPTPPSAGIWKPTSSAPISWYWQLQGTISTSPLKASVYDIDGFDVSADTVAALHANGAKVICYIDLGTSEDFRSDFNKFPKEVLGNTNGWPGERWLDIGSPTALAAIKPIMKARMQMCKDKGFDAIEPDNIDSYQNNPGFPTTAAQQAAYNQWIAETAHSLNMSVGLKNDLDQIPQLVSYFDWALNEQCNQYEECDTLAPFVKANKAVFNAEYKGTTASFCSAFNSAHINGALFDKDLTGSYSPCKTSSGTTW